MQPELIKLIADDLRIPVDDVGDAIRSARSRVRHIKIKKRDGGVRIAHQPSVALKPILLWVRSHLLQKLPVSSCAVAFRHGASILHNAEAHRFSLYSVRVDLKDFFPSVTSNDLGLVLRKNLSVLDKRSEIDDLRGLVEWVCFDSKGRLPIGYATSPDIANAVMFDIDNNILKEVSDPGKYGVAVVTRYADDFVFSTDKKGACRSFLGFLRRLLGEVESPRLRINDEKTRFMSRNGGSTLVTGLRITDAGTVRAHADYRDHVRLLLRLNEQGRLGDDDKRALVGHLAYIEHIDPTLFTRLSFRFHSQIRALRGGVAK